MARGIRGAQGKLPDRALLTVRVLAFLCAVLSLMCVALAYAWQGEREHTACWRTAAEFQIAPQGDCDG